MSWDLHVADAESLLVSSRIPSSLEIISLIKRINPTRLPLSESDRERGYRMKNVLQNLLLEQYGETFHLVPHPCSTDIVLIKHNTLPSIDACHAVIGAFSEKALCTVADPEEIPAQKQPPKGKAKMQTPSSPKDAVREAQRLLEGYEYSQAEELLSGIRIDGNNALSSLVRAATMLVEEIGAYGTAIETLLSQPKPVLKDTAVRELLALAYYRNGMIPEARALFDALPAADLGKNSLCAYADISFKDGSLAHAYHLLKEAGAKKGFAADHAPLKKEVEAAMLAEAQPWLQKAEEALCRDHLAQAESLSHEALARYPALQRAGEILAMVNARRESEELGALWGRFERSEHGAPRLELLETLLERDAEQKEKIAQLMAAEEAVIKKELVESRLQALRKEVQEERWRECYHIIDWLSRQTDHAEAYREACDLSPYFTVLYLNRRLQKVAGKTAKEAWLRFVQARSALQAGEREGCLEMMEGIREYFEQYPEFAEDYRFLLTCEQESARSEITDLLQQVEGDEWGAVRLSTVFNRIRKKMAILPEEERSAYGRIMQDRLALLRPKPDEEAVANAYNVALLFGNLETASQLRKMIDDPSRAEQVEKDIAGLMKLEASPVTLAFSDDIPVDLTSQPPLSYRGSTDRHIFLVDDEGALIMVDLQAMSATRFSPSCLRGAYLTDALPAKGIFLFRAYEKSNYLARAELSSSRGAITSIFDAARAFRLEEGTTITDIYLSSERGTDYYLNTRDKEGSAPATMGRQRLGSRNGMADAVQIKNDPRLYSWRLSSDPDKFIIGATDETRVCARNLTLDFSIGMTPEIWEVDEANGHIYYFYSHMLKRVDFGFNDIKEFPDSSACFFFRECHKVLGVCPATNTVQVALGQRAAMYDFGANNLSAPFTAGAVVSTRPARKWYCVDYKKDALKLTLRDVTHELGSLLEWKKVPISTTKEWSDEECNEAHGQLYFGYKSEDKPGIPIPLPPEAGEEASGDTAQHPG